jgi:uncharacterized protein YbjT (DUF2867 family)
MNRRSQEPTLVLGGTGKTGRRVVERLAALGLRVRVGSRSAEPRFDWDDRSTWAPVLEGVGSAWRSGSRRLDPAPHLAQRLAPQHDLVAVLQERARRAVRQLQRLRPVP